MSDCNEIYWLWLSNLTSLSQKTRNIIFLNFPNPGDLYEIKEKDLSAMLGIRAADADVIKSSDIAETENILKKCSEYGIEIINYSNPLYPERVRNIYAPPAVLYVKGKIPKVDDKPLISVIGTRKSTAYGIKTAENIAYEIVKCGGGVVTLLTPGAGTAAAEGALCAEGICLAVMADPVDEGKGELFEKIVTFGAAVSEYPPGCKHNRFHYREQNRLAAGLSVGAVVIEAPSKSGTSYFVDDILEQGKDVFAVPGNVDSTNSEGPIKLIREGAVPVASGWDVMREYQGIYADVAFNNLKLSEISKAENKTAGRLKKPDKATYDNKVDKAKNRGYIDRDTFSEGLSPDQKSVIYAVSDTGSTVDEIINLTGLPAAKVLSQLTVLEIKGKLYKDRSKKIMLNISKE